MVLVAVSRCTQDTTVKFLGGCHTKGNFHLNFAMAFAFTRKKDCLHRYFMFPNETSTKSNNSIYYLLSTNSTNIVFFCVPTAVRIHLSVPIDRTKLKFGFVPFLPAQDFS